MPLKEYLATDHDIDVTQIDQDALSVLEKLRSAGFTAYLVGGSVRDLLIKKRPKDFDISTSALPEEVKDLFGRQCILIGKRFRLAHVRYGRNKVFEVATFRSGEDDSGLILQDNQWGTPEQDARRRDFTINGLFYDPFNHTVIDYIGGWDDIHQRTLRTIGDPTIRFKQDPVRMLRLIKFKARFDFKIDPLTEKSLRQCLQEIKKSSPARLLEEFFKMLESGASAPFFLLMLNCGLLEHCFPLLARFLASKPGQIVYRYLGHADKIIQTYGCTALKRPILAACLLFPLLEYQIQAQYTSQKKIPHIGEVMLVTTSVIKSTLIAAFPHFPRSLSSMINFVLSTQYRLTPLTQKRHYSIKVLRNKEFISALKFLKIRSLVIPQYSHEYSAWKKMFDQHHSHSHSHPSKPHNPPPSRPIHT